ncbi:MAG: SAM-dependent methyltransferase, partial [Spirochaetota bacterium]|nr:SAM-dependent methyltransferase [Spirochaetota bacterium]
MSSGHVYLIGAGPGDARLITLKALDALADSNCI